MCVHCSEPGGMTHLDDMLFRVHIMHWHCHLCVSQLLLCYANGRLVPERVAQAYARNEFVRWGCSRKASRQNEGSNDNIYLMCVNKLATSTSALAVFILSLIPV